MKEIQWLNEREFAIGGVKFCCALDDYSLKTNSERFVILKNREVLRNYAVVFADGAPKTMLEFGIFQGGSPALFSLWFDVDKFVGVDIGAPVGAFDQFCRTHQAGKNIRSYYGVSQTDRHRVGEIAREEFGATPLDVVIDDASHHYGATRRTFEVAFPLLRPGGIYVIEDWEWAHWPGNQLYMGETALSMLVMELMMLCASRSDIVSEVRVFPSFAFIRKSSEAKPAAAFSLDSLYCKRGIELVGSKNTNLRGVASLLTARVMNDMRRKLKRMTRGMRRHA